ncbi:MAG: M23 family metallopeptidase [Enhydrobacter sp.]|nr:MAG: M23 family metallopeptidase [Enhydrobacter sp.]
MNMAPWAVVAAALCIAASPAAAVTPLRAEAALERVLGADPATAREHLPFTRRSNASGRIAGSLAESMAAAGVPRAALVEPLRALTATLDVARDTADGDRFWVRHERAFTLDGQPTGIGRVLWLEVASARKGRVAIHRFRASGAAREAFWLASGEGTEATAIRLPLDTISVSSGFGMRADPFDQPSGSALAMGPAPRPAASPAPGNVNMATPLGISLGLSPGGATTRPTTRSVLRRGALSLHAGVDFVADPGTPVHAAADGVVLGAHYKGAYGNWIEIVHGAGLATVYGHLSAYAPGTVAGAAVERGQVIGYVGNTGRSTGAHLHFELVVDGRPVDPMKHGGLGRTRLSGADLARFEKAVEADLAEAAREGKPR